MQLRPVFENDVVAEVPTWVYGPPLVVERRMLYDVAPADAWEWRARAGVFEDLAVVNEAAAQRWFPGSDPVGRRISIRGLELEVIGVAPGELMGRCARCA